MSSALRRRGPFLLLGAAALVTGVWSGLLRLGAASSPVPAMAHGPLMISGFLGTVIALERAVASRTRWAFVAPALCGSGAVALVAGQPLVGALLMTLGSALIVLVQVSMLRRGVELHLVVLTLAAVSCFIGNAALAAGRPVFDVVAFWLAFLIGTIGAERLELNRLLPRTPLIRAVFLAGLAFIGLGALLSLVNRDLGLRLLGGGALVVALWLLRYDIARRTILQTGAVRYIAAALLGGYGWLALGGALALWSGNPLAGPSYDALLHAMLVGFVFSMIFGHAPIIFPAVMRVKIPYHPAFYLPLLVLHASLALRVTGGLGERFTWLSHGGLINAVALLLFILTLIGSVRRGRHAPAGNA